MVRRDPGATSTLNWSPLFSKSFCSHPVPIRADLPCSRTSSRMSLSIKKDLSLSGSCYLAHHSTPGFSAKGLKKLFKPWPIPGTGVGEQEGSELKRPPQERVRQGG